jgi:hypothetical protein
VGAHCGRYGQVNQGKGFEVGFAEIGIIQIVCYDHPELDYEFQGDLDYCRKAIEVAHQ